MSAQNWAGNVLVLREKLYEHTEPSLIASRVQTNVLEAITDYLSELRCSEARLRKVFLQLLKAGKVRVRFPKFEERMELLDYGLRSEEPWIQSQIDQCILLIRESCDKACSGVIVFARFGAVVEGSGQSNVSRNGFRPPRGIKR
jgi:hypothetical protein